MFKKFKKDEQKIFRLKSLLFECKEIIVEGHVLHKFYEKKPNFIVRLNKLVMKIDKEVLEWKIKNNTN